MLTWEMKHGLDAPYGDVELQCHFKPTTGAGYARSKAKQAKATARQEARVEKHKTRKKGKRGKSRKKIQSAAASLKKRQTRLTATEKSLRSQLSDIQDKKKKIPRANKRTDRQKKQFATLSARERTLKQNLK